MRFYLMTQNDLKYNEINNLFKSYGLTIKKVSNVLEVLSEEKEYNYTEYSVLMEQTSLIRGQSIVGKSNLSNLDLVSHLSKLKVDIFKDKKLVLSEFFESIVDGFIDFSRKENVNNVCAEVYNWDDIFVELETMKTYQEMKNKSNKFSARTKVVSEYLHSVMTFESKIDLNFNPMNQQGVLSFSNDIYNLIDGNEILLKHKGNELLSGLIRSIKSDGLFTRSAVNRNQRNYWYPSLNAGLPLVPKKDEIHEITFMFHDLMHHAMPDLILNGDDSKEVREAYIVHRMLSEAITIVLADMVFVDELVTSGYDYDWTKRRIYPIYEEFKKGGVSLDRVKELVWANVEFALLGNIEPLILLSSESLVLDYKEKYESFFIEDYRWTVNNYDSMMSSRDTLLSWNEGCKDIMPSDRMVSVYSDLIFDSGDYDSSVSIIFEKMWSMLMDKANNNIEFNIKKANKNTLNNYMIGQMYIFFKLEDVENTKLVFETIKSELKLLDSVTVFDIDRVRKFFNLYLEKLNKRNIITKTELNNYKEIVPLFETFFVFYERDLKYNSIKEVVEKLVVK